MKHYYNPDRIFMDFIGKTNDFDEKDLEIINLASKLYDEIIPVVIDGEIRRGEAKTQYTRYLEEIVCLYGVDNFAKLLFVGDHDLKTFLKIYPVYYIMGKKNRQ